MPKKNDFWGNFSRTVDFQPAANLIATSIIENKKKQDEADKLFYEEQQKNLAEAQAYRKKLDAYDKLISGTKEQTFYERPRRTDLSSDLVNGRIEITETPTTQPLLKARTENIPLTQREKIGLGLDSGLTFDQIKKLTTPKKKEYSSFQEGPYQRYGRNKETNQWELLESFNKEKGEINPAYNPSYREAEINLTPKVKMINGEKYFVTDIGLLDPKADYWKKDEKGDPFIVKSTEKRVTEKTKNGDDVLNKSLKTNLENLFETQMQLTAQLNNASQNPDGVVVDANGKQVYEYEYDKDGYVLSRKPVTAEDLKNRLIGHKQQTINFLDNLSSENLDQWKKVTSTQMTPKEYWDALQEGYVKGYKDKNGKVKKLDDYDLEIGSLYYRALYNRIPQNYYGEE